MSCSEEADLARVALTKRVPDSPRKASSTMAELKLSDH